MIEMKTIDETLEAKRQELVILMARRSELADISKETEAAIQDVRATMRALRGLKSQLEKATPDIDPSIPPSESAEVARPTRPGSL